MQETEQLDAYKCPHCGDKENTTTYDPAEELGRSLRNCETCGCYYQCDYETKLIGVKIRGFDNGHGGIRDAETK